ncbi:hypothetical protein TNCV_587051 [Trichonephila clavipes]|nr:hypothetical protein TNCV_587051 [Trichonephila clavipes]
MKKHFLVRSKCRPGQGAGLSGPRDVPAEQLRLLTGYLSTTKKVPRHKIRAHYEQLSEFEGGLIIGLKEAVVKIGELFVIWVEVMRLIENADKNGWTVADFSVMIAVIDVGPQKIRRTA